MQVALCQHQDVSGQDAFDAEADAVCMHFLRALVHSANHSSLLSRYDYVHLQSESACSADIQLCTNHLRSKSRLGT